MKHNIGIAVICILSFFANPSFGQQAAYYEKARDAYLNAAAKTKCPDRARVLQEYANWNQCMVDVLAGRKKSCPDKITTPIPACDGDRMGGGSGTPGSANSSSGSSYNNTDDLANSLKEVIDGISELAKIKLDDNAKSDFWMVVSGGANFDGSGGPVAGTSADIGHPAGYFFSFDALSRKGMSVLCSFNDLKSNYFHSFRAKGDDGIYRQYIGRTDIEAPIMDISLAKDFTGPTGSFHFVPNIGADLFFDIKNHFTSTNFAGVTYEEEWDKNLFFAVHCGVQMFYFFSKRFALQGGGKYVFFPSETGTVFKTGNFFHLNAGLVIRII